MFVSARRRCGQLALAVAACAFSACSPFYGADFDYPADPPVPDGVYVLASDTAEDDDDPLRSRQRVIDLDGQSLPAVIDFYGRTYPSSDGWEEVQVDDTRQPVCLVNRPNDRFTEVVEMFPYTGRRVEQQPDRYLVTVSRYRSVGNTPCAGVWAWLPGDLF